jgi:hypothetical protein
MFTFCQPQASITGLSFSSDTIYGWQTDSQPQRLSITNNSSYSILIDSIIFDSVSSFPYYDLPLWYSVAPGLSWPANGWHEFAFPKSYSSPKPSFLINSQDSFIASNVSLLGFYAGKRYSQKIYWVPLYPLITIFHAGSETDTVVFVVTINGVGEIERNSFPNGFQGKILANPNPFSTITRISILSSQPLGNISINNIQGVCVSKFNHLATNEIIWNPANLPGGIYFLQYEKDGKINSHRIILLR